MLTNTMTAVSSDINIQQQGPLGERLAAHLLRRCSFHFTRARVKQLALLTADQAVDLLFNTASPAPYLTKPLYAHVNTGPIYDWIDNPNISGAFETNKRRAVMTWWLRNAMFDDTAHHKTAFFLHTTFTTGHEMLSVSGNGTNYNAQISRYLYDHVRLYDWLTYSGRTLKDAAVKITVDNMMLGYLDNFVNSSAGLNENFSRELLELFTIGQGANLGNGQYENYDETDVTVAAEVLTGFSLKANRNVSDIDPQTGIPKGTPFPADHITGNKQFSAKFTGPNNPVIGVANPTEADMEAELAQFIDMIFDQPATAENYAEKLYRYYVQITLDPMIIQQMAADLLANGYDYIETIKLLLKSQHFYQICSAIEDESNGNLIKSPLEMLSEAFSFFLSDLPPITNTADTQEIYDHFFIFGTAYLFNRLGQETDMLLFSPQNVAGYPAYYQEPTWDKNWYTPGTIPTRFDIGPKFVSFYNSGFNPKTRIDTVAWANYLDAQGLDVSDADVVLDEALHIFPQAISAARRVIILDIFLLNLSDINWMFLWNCYKGYQPQPPSGCNLPVGNPDDVRPHLDALVVAVLAAHEFQLK